MRDLVQGLPGQELSLEAAYQNLSQVLTTLEQAPRLRPVLKVQKNFHDFIEDYIKLFPKDLKRVETILTAYGYQDILN